MELIDLMRQRRSIREFKDQAIHPKQIDQIIQAGMLAPSSMDKRPVEFIVVQDPENIAKLKQGRPSGTKALEEARCAIVVIVDKKSDVWQEDGSIAMTYMMLMATNLGLGSCWIQGWQRTTEEGQTCESYLRDFLHFPDHYGYLATLALGVPKVEQPPYPENFIERDKLHRETF